MSETVKIKAADGHEFDAYVARPSGEGRPRGLVVLQEIFGVNPHIRAVADGYAADGFLAVAPALFDRLETGAEMDYSPESIQRGAGMAMKLGGDAMKDVAAAIRWLRAETGSNPAVVGYCFGGTLAWLSATMLGDDTPAAAVPYYGGQIVKFADTPPNCPVEMHFGEYDGHIPMSDVEAIKAKRPEVTVHVYPAGHGFNCTERADYDPASAKLARERTLAFLKLHMPR